MEIKKIEDLTLEEIENIHLLDKQDIEKMEFAELCIYLENLNKLETRYKELLNNN